MPKQRLLGLLVAALTIVPAASAVAAPATVSLRVEGSTRTLFEGTVTTDVRTFRFTNSSQTYTCDGTAPDGTAAAPSPTRNGALITAAESNGFSVLGTFGQFGASFTEINGENVDYDPQTKRFLAEYKNGQFANFGGCGDTITTGDEVLYAYGDGSEQLLRLAGPATAPPSSAIRLRVTDAASGAAVPGAVVGISTTGADGTALVVTPAQRGFTRLKASKAGAIRSNRVDVCVTDGADGYCGTTVPEPAATTPAATTPAPAASTPAPAATTPAAPAVAPATSPAPTNVVAPDRIAAFGAIGSITEGKRFAKGAGPRTLAGRVDLDRSGLKDVRLRLSRTDGKRCARYDGALERFVATTKCGIKNARTFSVGANASFSYLLPSALPRGRYVLDVVVYDRAGNQTRTYQRGRNRVVFTVG